MAAHDLVRGPPEELGRGLGRGGACGRRSRYTGSAPVSSLPWSFGLKRRTRTAAPATVAAMSAAATSACCAASPPCFTGRVVMSPTAQTRVDAADPAVYVDGHEPVVVAAGRQAPGRQSRQGDHEVGFERSLQLQPELPSANSCANEPVRRCTPASASRPATAALASRPNSPSGSDSRVTSSDRDRGRAAGRAAAVMSASS